MEISTLFFTFLIPLIIAGIVLFGNFILSFKNMENMTVDNINNFNIGNFSKFAAIHMVSGIVAFICFWGTVIVGIIWLVKIFLIE